MDLTALEPLDGGWSGQTFLAHAAGERSVVRIYPPGVREDRGAEVDAAVLRLVRGLVPVPEVLEVRPSRPELDQPGLLVTSYVEGVRADLLPPEELRLLAPALGALVADLGGMPVLHPGPFVDPELRIGRFGDGLPAYVEERLPELGHLGPAEIEGLRDVAADAQTLLDTVTRSCLVHGDLNLKNLLVDPETSALTAVLDWEFAHAGHPFTDLGNLLRFERDEVFTEAVLAAYAERRGTPPEEALALARAADLVALVDLTTRRSSSPAAARADRLLRGIARERDAGAAELAAPR